MVDITPEYTAIEIIRDFEYQDEYMHTIRTEDEIQKAFAEAVKKVRMYGKNASFDIHVGIQKHKQNHISVAVKLKNIKLPEAEIEPTHIFVDARNKCHKHGDPNQLKIGENVTDIKKEQA